MRPRALCFLLSAVFMLSACASGTRLLNEPIPGTPESSLAQAADDNLTVELTWVIVRDGPGAWARNADWDEYQLLVHATTTDLIVHDVTVVDSLGYRVPTSPDRSALVDGSRRTQQRYEDSGIEVRAGWSAGTLAAAGVVTYYGVGAPLAVAALTTGSSAAAAVSLGAVVITPVLLVSSYSRMRNNNRVAAQIQQRASRLPVTVQAGETVALDLFYPFAPSPQRVEVLYSIGQVRYVLVVDTSTVLAGLHLDQAVASD